MEVFEEKKNAKKREIRVLGEKGEVYAGGLLESSPSSASKKGRFRLGRDEFPSIVGSTE